MPTTYDPEIIITMADRLYSRANNIVLETTVKYVAVGTLVAVGIGYAIRLQNDTPWTGPLAGVIGIVSAFVGYGAGRERAFALRVEAQQLLVMVQIERNTSR